MRLCAVLAAVLLLPLAACGPTAEQLSERQAAAGPSSAPTAPRPRPAPPVPAAPATAASTAASAPEPMKVGVSGSQAGMPQAVQDACQFLLRRDPAAPPPDEAASCVRAAMTAGGGAVQTLETASSWLPQGTHTVEFTTSPEFSMTLENPDLKLAVTAGAGGGSVDTGGGRIAAVPGGTPEEAYAAVLVSAAELTANPERVGALLAGSVSLEVDHTAVLNGAVRTKISGLRPGDADADDMMPTGVTLWLDDYYRPVRYELTGRARGITSSITAVNSGWGAGR
ncbi:hypothetical protein OL239_09725 [Arthrobacter sp. ATA002]|uniref:hypothetical protein n=1 Tax=Arthrobacter sp. ATA002 TaxID=2991715 RepID=UPI0022A7401C|nr:hypothetical protein [Arthrobacter sp. ATA002]WAP50375.1 hypothetical protein OL239_09725 [Arthrobacter sp. ATA002]